MTPPKRLSNYLPSHIAEKIGDSDCVEMGRQGALIWLRMAGCKDLFVRDGCLADRKEWKA